MPSASMPTLALDVDGVLLDPEREGRGLWTDELADRFGIGEDQMRAEFFMQGWRDVLRGRLSIETVLGEALRRIGAVVPLDRVFYSADLGCEKHDRRFFELASQRLGLTDAQRSSVIFVDDVAGNVEVARAVGWHAVHASADESWRGEVEARLGLHE